ncbi:MAG TPA: trehalose-phosphatase [Pseudonocardiaceae bacterium]|jgi:trehalose-phosphatase|nr:trehalose-phosphatase [Pseudonocardiaceae bacterium]
MTAENLPVALRRALAQLARSPRLLVACDYDGTLAPIVEDPDRAFPRQESVAALRLLAGLPETTVAVISGRALRDLATLSRLPGEVHLVGSHGSEFDAGFVHALAPRVVALRQRLYDELARLVDGYEGVSLEVKPASVAVHVRRAVPEVAEQVLSEVLAGPCGWDGVQVTQGKSVVELAVVQTDKGQALDILRHQVGATAAVFLGDDVTDEKVFTRLTGPDLGIKVGTGQSLAGYRVQAPEDVAMVLAVLVEERRHWLFGEQAVPIERHSMLSNGRIVALLTPDARVSWMCHPEADAGAVFADLLGGPGAGYFSIRPVRNGLPLGQRYVPGTMTVETRWSRLLVTDYLVHLDEVGRNDLVRVVSGHTQAMVEFVPRPEFGQVPVRLEAEPDGLRVLGTSDPMVLRCPGVRWEISNDGRHSSAQALIEPNGSEIVFELRCGSDDLGPSAFPEREQRRRASVWWSDWLAGLTLPAVHRDLVARSALTLRGLCHSETGAIMAAATTSLPEEIGGVRNWDYRYCWLRDGAMSARALVSLGSLGEADGFLDWLHRVLETVATPERLHPLYTIQGTALGPEAVLDTLPGYAGSRPVRVSNAATQQVQLDVFGPVVELIADLSAARGSLTDRDWELVQAMTEAVARRWHEPDHGIWEIRGAPRHHVYSKVMCWVTVDRALALAAAHGRSPDPGWAALRAEIADDVLAKGWNDDAQAFTTAYDGVDLDAASLHVGLARLIDPSDERYGATVTAIEAELRSGSTVYRYKHDDGLPGEEGGFHLCAAWMVEAYLACGRRTEAEQLFQQLVDVAGPTGLLSEEYDPVAERSLGNHPQAYSHLGLIRCAQLLSSGRC